MELTATELPARSEQASESELLLAELQPLVVRVARLIVGSRSGVAEDAAQEALLELSRALPRLKSREAGPAFAARIATRVATRMAKRERRFAFLGLRVQQAPGSLANGQPPELVELKDAFDRLPAGQRATAVLRLYVGLSEQETAEALGCSVGTVKHQLHDARTALAAYLDDGSQAAKRRRGRS